MGPKNEIDEVDQTKEEINKLSRFGLDADGSWSFLECIEEYCESLFFLGQYDQTQEGIVDIAPTNKLEPYILKKEQANSVIRALKDHLENSGENVGLFGIEHNGGVDKVVGNIYQGSSEGDYYPSIESKAAHLLYFLVKDHLFVDGNKRIAAFLFTWFLDMNGMLSHGAKKALILSYGTIYKLTVFIAESDPKDKDLIVGLIMHIVSFHKEILLDQYSPE